jgi:hypothetical protein
LQVGNTILGLEKLVRKYIREPWNFTVKGAWFNVFTSSRPSLQLRRRINFVNRWQLNSWHSQGWVKLSLLGENT